MPQDVVDLIMSDHREVERLFEIMRTQPDQRASMAPVAAALLTAHSRAEEAEVYPVARDEAGAAEDVQHSQEEHLQAERLLERLQSADPTSSEFDNLLREVVDAVNHHVQEEELSVLPMMRERLDAARREELAEAFTQSRAQHLGEMPGEPSRDEMQAQARNVGMSGAASMSKQELGEELNKQADR